MKEIDAASLINEMRAMAKASSASAPTVNEASKIQDGQFKELLKSALDKVNQTQVEATELSKAFAAGDPNVTLPETMIAIQKSHVSLQMATTVRDHVVRAYNDIYSMPI